MKKTIFLLLGFLIITSFTKQDASERYYSDSEYSYVFHINLSDKKIKLKEDVKYYWFKSKEINITIYGYDGNVLHGKYLKRKVKSNELLEKGSFKYGVKVGVWKNWYIDGKLAKVENWQKGLRSGNYKAYNTNGDMLFSGKYTNGKKEGKWIDFQKGDTTYYHKGEIKPKKTFKIILKNIFKKKKKRSQKVKKQFPKKNSQKKTTKKKQLKSSKKKSFWKRIFKKKSK